LSAYAAPHSCSPRHRPTFPLFPYTTLFRSDRFLDRLLWKKSMPPRSCRMLPGSCPGIDKWVLFRPFAPSDLRPDDPGHWRQAPRSEEHTSELQSRENLVCRLLLEKKKQLSQ